MNQLMEAKKPPEVKPGEGNREVEVSSAPGLPFSLSSRYRLMWLTGSLQSL